MTEHWNLYLNLDYQAAPWPWAGKTLSELTPADVSPVPNATTDFLRYSPTDGSTDRVHVPGSLPREVPMCETALAIYHDPNHVYVFIASLKPAAPIPELADCPNEDFSVVLSSGCAGRGLYFGMNQNGESIGCSQIWDADIPFEEGDNGRLFAKITTDGVAGPSGWRSGRLDGMYAARVVTTEDGLVGCFQISRDLVVNTAHTPHLHPLPQGARRKPDESDGLLPLHSGERGWGEGVSTESVRLSVGRVCYATGESVSWGSPIVWSAREDLHGTVRLVESVQAARQPTLTRLDLGYAPESETAVLQASWQGTAPEIIHQFEKGNYAGYADKVTFALNSREVTVPLAAATCAGFELPDGWTRLEVMTAANPVKEISFQKVSGRVIQSRVVCDLPHDGRDGSRPSSNGGTTSVSSGAGMPPLVELREAFARWHESHDQTCLAGGIWGDSAVAGRRHCLCHAGIFHIEPYLVASRCLGREPIYDQRIRETCERMLAEQKPAGWYPCYCSANAREPELGDGGAFTNGSVGEGMVLAAELVQEQSWLDSTKRAADYSWYRWENNQNYAAFALWHLAALYERNQEKRWLDQALYLARHFVTRDIGLSGAQGGHNYFSAYGNITLKGMARLLTVLPAGHEFRPVLQDKLIRFANQILSRQQTSGLFAGRNRKYLGYHHPVPGLFFVADAVPDQTARLEPALAAMTRAIMRGGKEDPKRQVDSDTGLVLALAARFVSCR